MLSKVYEWSRVVNPDPDDDFVAKRKTIISSLADNFVKNVPLLVDSACAAAVGVVPRFAQDSPLVTSLVSAIREVQPAFPEALAENKLDLRVGCALLVGEVADRAANGKGLPSESSRVMASVVCAALQNKLLSGPKHLQSMLAGLTSISGAALKRAAEGRRRRYTLASYVDAIAEAPDAPAFWKSAKPQFMKLAQVADSNASIDREELDTLWWSFNGVSRITDSSYADLPLGTAALYAGLELAELVLLPPLPNTKFLLRRALGAGRKADALDKMPLRDMIVSWDATNVQPVISARSATSEFIRANPAVFPLTWACQRLGASGSLPPAEFKKLSGRDPAQTVTPESVAYQMFDETVALRYCEAHLSE